MPHNSSYMSLRQTESQTIVIERTSSHPDRLQRVERQHPTSPSREAVDQEKKLSEELTMMTMETVSRRLVENALTAARKWLKDDASACYCGLALDVDWLRAVGCGHQLDGDVDRWWRIEAHLRRCLNMKADEIGELMSTAVLENASPRSSSRWKQGVRASQAIPQFHSSLSSFKEPNSERTEYIEVLNDRQPVPFPIRIHIEIPDRLWQQHLETIGTTSSNNATYLSTANFYVDQNGSVELLDNESEDNTTSGEIFV